jgi:PPM family protein phosphatase
VDWNDCLQYVTLTHVGMRRSNNQDSHAFLLADSEETWQQRGHIFIVADGMGGHAGGELASRLAAERIPHKYVKYRDQAAPEALLKAVLETNTEVNRRGNDNPDFRDMGTTATTFVLLPQGLLAAHIGDSRLYRLRGETLHQLTFDHSVDWELRAAGHIQEGSELAAMVPKNQITRSLGPNPTVQADLEGPYPVEIGDTFLACSDGLVRKVADTEIAAILAALPPKDAAQALIDLANLRGGPDNITVIIVKATGPRAVSANSRAIPLTLKSGEKPKPVHPAFWLVPAVCLLAGIILVVSGQYIPGAVAAVGALVGLGIALTQGGSKADRLLAAGQRLGRGPYTEFKADTADKLIDGILESIDNLREVTIDNEWGLNWDKFDKLWSEVNKSQTAGDAKAAISHALKATGFIQSEVQRHKDKKNSDSSIEY